MKLCVTTVITTEWDLPTTAETLAAIGYDGVEWRICPGCSLSNETATEQAQEIRDLCAAHNLEIPAIAANIDPGNKELLSEIFEAGRAMGAKTSRVQAIRYDGTVDYNDLVTEAREWLPTVVEVAERTGVKACLELHGGTIIPSASACRRLIEGLDPQWLGVIFDPGNQVREGMEHWKLGLECLGEYLELVHVKDCGWFRIEDAAGPTWTTVAMPLGEGICGWKTIVGFLKEIGYDGYLSLEDFTDRSAQEKCRAAYEFLKALI